jgi:hypothetical protein
MSSRSFDAAIFWEMDWVGLAAVAGVDWAIAGAVGEETRKSPAVRTAVNNLLRRMGMGVSCETLRGGNESEIRVAQNGCAR